jgi:hypothetical protein
MSYCRKWYVEQNNMDYRNPKIDDNNKGYEQVLKIQKKKIKHDNNRLLRLKNKTQATNK